MRKGFTLIEILVGLAFISILSSMAVITYVRAQRKASLDTLSQQTVSILRRAQQKAIAQEEETAWGVHFENPTSTPAFIALFTGAAYNPINIRESSFLPKPLIFITPASGATADVIFSKFTGTPAGPQDIVIQVEGEPALTRTITVNAAGIVSVQE